MKKKRNNIKLEAKRIITDIEKAKHEIIVAEKIFHFVNDPEMVDVAIYDLEAKKSRYSYLIRQAKEKGIKKDIQELLVESLAK